MAYNFIYESDFKENEDAFLAEAMEEGNVKDLMYSLPAHGKSNLEKIAFIKSILRFAYRAGYIQSSQTEKPMNKTIYIVTATGVSIDTEVHPVTSYEKAKDIAEDLKLKFLVENIDEMRKDCWKGHSRYAQCNIEIQIHEEILKNA